jgi:N-acetyl-anhydromuramyl-L-alanine amidase AmpD
VLEFSRHPNLDFFTPEECDALDLSPDPRRVPLLGEQDEEEMPTKPVGAVLPNYVQAVNYTPASGRAIDLVVIHTMEAPEKPGTAKAVAQWFASKNAPKASAHYSIDDQTTIQCVREQDVAWAAPGTNHNGIQLEHAGYASQTPSQWEDVYSRAVLERSAVLCARICERHHIPVVYVDAEGLLRGDRGVTTHAQVTKACALAKSRNATKSPFFKARTTHTDPGPNFPMTAYLSAVASHLEKP